MVIQCSGSSIANADLVHQNTMNAYTVLVPFVTRRAIAADPYPDREMPFDLGLQ
jgi:hypothetical protein